MLKLKLKNVFKIILQGANLDFALGLLMIVEFFSSSLVTLLILQIKPQS